MIGLVFFYLFTIIVLFILLSSRNAKLKECEEQLQRTENANEVLEERVRTLQAVKTHHEYILNERDNQNAELYERVLQLEIKLRTKNKRR